MGEAGCGGQMAVGVIGMWEQWTWHDASDAREWDKIRKSKA
jgi:hypothetical protein